jgi:hypothetical protein
MKKKIKKVVKKQTSLQKFTETKINNLFKLEQITFDELKKLTKEEFNRFMIIYTEKMNTLKGLEMDELCKKVDPILNQDTRNQLWESNHNQITWAIATLMQEYNRMPSKTEIATKTELSRQTVNKHLKEYAVHPLYLEQIEQFRFMTSKVLAKVYKFAVNGDIGAAKLYFNIMGCLGSQQPYNTLIQTQNNYIQINGIVISQETIKNLNPEQLNVIETIFRTTLPPSEISEA